MGRLSALGMFAGQMVGCWWPLAAPVGVALGLRAARAVTRAWDRVDPYRIAARVQAGADDALMVQLAANPEFRAALQGACDDATRAALSRELDRRWASDGDLRTLLARADRLPKMRRGDHS